MRMPNRFTFIILLLGSFIFDQEEDMDSALQDEEEETYMADPEDRDFTCTDDVVIGCGDGQAEIPSDAWPLSSHNYPREEQASNDFTEFADEYRLHCSEDISQKPSAMEGEKHPSWLMEHLDGIKETLEKELVDLQDDFRDPFELNYDETIDEMEEIRKMEEKTENNDQSANRESAPIYPGSRLNCWHKCIISDGSCSPPFPHWTGLKRYP